MAVACEGIITGSLYALVKIPTEFFLFPLQGTFDGI